MVSIIKGLADSAQVSSAETVIDMSHEPELLDPVRSQWDIMFDRLGITTEKELVHFMAYPKHPFGDDPLFQEIARKWRELYEQEYPNG